MNKRNLQFILFITTILFSINAKAQHYPDYVITVEGDSIRCLVSYGGAEYQDSTTATVQKITSDRVREYYDNEQRRLFRAVYIDDATSRTFLAYAEKGKISLYYKLITNATGNIEIIWYTGKNSDRRVYGFKTNSIFTTKKDLRDDCAVLFKDNPQVYNKFVADNDYDYVEIQKMVHLYNTGEIYDGSSDGAVPVLGRSYIVTQKNDTVFCRIKNDYFTRRYMFKLANEDNFNNIDSANAKEFFYTRDTSHFALVNEPGVPNKVFLKQLAKGRVNLYQKTIIGDDKNRKELQSNLYINKENGPLVLIGSRPNRARRFDIKNAQLDIFFKAIADNESLLVSCKKTINTSAMTKDEVIRYFVQNYNDLYSANSKPGQP